MILLTQEVKLKLQELLKAVKQRHEFSTMNQEIINNDCVLNIADELVKMLPPEVTDGVIDNVQETGRAVAV